MIAIVNYGVGNLFSLASSLRFLEIDSVITDDPQQIAGASHVILPGVGAFGDAAAQLFGCGLGGVVQQQAGAGKPLLGICVGMQLLYEASHEYGYHRGLGLVPGEVVSLREALRDEDAKVPQMGWNDLQVLRETPLLRYTKPGDHVYYVHSFFAPVTEDTIAASEYCGVEVTGIVQRGNVYGTQFHPEKSGRVGLDVLRAFAEL